MRESLGTALVKGVQRIVILIDKGGPYMGWPEVGIKSKQIPEVGEVSETAILAALVCI